MSGTYAAGSVEDELQKARFSKEALNQLMKFVESSLHIRHVFGRTCNYQHFLGLHSRIEKKYGFSFVL